MPKIKLNCHEQFENVQSMKNMRQDNNMTNCTCAVYTKNETKLSRPI